MSMACDVFISYASPDKKIAVAVCAKLEAAGIRCWIAPRDITPGEDWSAAIVGAIHTSRVMVLIFSGHSNVSQQTKREVERAVSKGNAIIPFRIEDIKPSRSLEFFISTAHWLDAITPPFEQHINRLASAVKELLKTYDQDDIENENSTINVEPGDKLHSQDSGKTSRIFHINRPSLRSLVFTLLIVIICLGALSAFFISRSGPISITSIPSKPFPTLAPEKAESTDSDTKEIANSTEILKSYKIDIYFNQVSNQDNLIALKIQEYLFQKIPAAQIIMAPRPVEFFSQIGKSSSYEVRYFYDSEKIAAEILVNELNNLDLWLNLTPVQVDVSRRPGILSIILCSQLQPKPTKLYKVGLQTLGVSNDEFKRLYESVLAQGFSQDEKSSSWERDQPWLAKKSTVIYYDENNRAKATELAKLMKSLTGERFGIARGSGYGIDPQEYGIQLVVHYIKRI